MSQLIASIGLCIGHPTGRAKKKKKGRKLDNKVALIDTAGRNLRKAQYQGRAALLNHLLGLREAVLVSIVVGGAKLAPSVARDRP